MENPLIDRKKGYLIILIAIITGSLYQALPHVISSTVALETLGAYFNVLIMFIVLFLLLKSEFLDWFKHFSFKWLIIGIPFLLIVGTLASSIWSLIAGGTTENSINSVLSWEYVIKNVPFMLLGEELLSIGVLYAAWKKLGWQFWQASRLVLNYLFKKSNSIWVTWIVHITFDVISFLPILLK
ncbi:hypothetical protein PGRAN_11701 [Listeria grandensis FSL F6-0971]|uniref:CPBP family intramembrane metalloprotease n=1 Tax=Listeria grandensis FSL F6-0971 TaxID=1265819 RepID=W7BDD4_9LIST|nr:hypothetical protein [Listeria grandensis]EUJ22815.1 hypothetical protein PGRAN_11701 [Listeria grandensis FSL F6-0971]